MNPQEYIKSISKKWQSGLATEHSYRSDLEALFSASMPGIVVTNEPVRTSCGAPDFIMTRRGVPVGFAEAKNIGEPLTGKKHQEQFERYRTSLPNLIFTDCLEFRLYVNGEFADSVRLGEVAGDRIRLVPGSAEAFSDLMLGFANHRHESIRSAQRLAALMASRARMLADIICRALQSDEHTSADNNLRDQLTAFQNVLIHDIDEQEFANIYAQTIAYGMFAARLHDQQMDTFSRFEAARLIPKSNPFLRKLFQYIAGYDLDERIDWVVDALADMFCATDVAALLKDFGKSTQQTDPVIHFYETFLAAFDPRLRKSRGVWYTPEPVVNFIVRAVDDILKDEFGLKDGLADTSKTRVMVKTDVKDKKSPGGYKMREEEVHKVQILDPATGTGTFLAEVIRQIHKKFEGQQGIWPDYVENHLIPRLNGFEILMASYAMAHLKLDMLLKETGYDRESNQRFRVYLTNSLEEHHPDTGTLFAGWLSNEANEANHIKRDNPVMVVLGNPPYSGESQNKGKWIMSLMEDYKKEPGGKEKLKERNPKWINDDYVKFLRFGQHFIEKNGEGILAFINPHGFLDNPTFRGMRWNLLKTYDKIYTIDLHGNSKKKETTPDGSQDDNVFDIQQGVSINVMIKTGNKKFNELGEVFHVDLYGLRKDKYNALWSNSISSLDYMQLPKLKPMYYWVRKDFEAEKLYKKGFELNSIFNINSVGIVTARDNFTIHNSRNSLKNTLDIFINLDNEEARKIFLLGKDVRDWKVQLAKEDLIESGLKEQNYIKISYRPFDERWTYYTGKSKGFHCMPRGELMKHLIKVENVGIVFSRQSTNENWSNIQVSDKVIDNRYHFSYKGIPQIAPIYVYPNSNQQTLDGTPERRPNLNPEILKKIAEGLRLEFTPEKEETEGTYAPIDLLDYIYAVLHSPVYRETYKEFLKIDFPRVPYPEDPKQFWKLVELGGELRKLHLMEHPLLDTFITTYPKAGTNEITRKITSSSPGYEPNPQDPNLGKVAINEQQYFGNLPLTAWEFYIGGYQPAQKWLKDRRGRVLSMEEIQHYQRIIVALVETERVMGVVDEIFNIETGDQ